MSVQTKTIALTTTLPRIADLASAKRRRMLLLGLVLSLSTLGGGSLTAHAAVPYGSFLLQTPTVITGADAPNFAWTVGDYNRDGRPDLFAIKVKRTGSGAAEVHVLNGASNYQSFLLQTSTAITGTDAPNFVWAVGDDNRDGRPDLFAIKVNKTGSGMAEVHILDGASNYQSFLLHTPTAITAADARNFTWSVGSYNRDGRPDLYAIKVNKTGSGMAEVHVLDRASNYQSFLLHTPTAITAALAKGIAPTAPPASIAPTKPPKPDAPNFVWAMGDYNRDGNADLYAVKVSNTASPLVGSPMAEVHILSGQ
jgi:FG-GAP-like repeat